MGHAASVSPHPKLVDNEQMLPLRSQLAHVQLELVQKVELLREYEKIIHDLRQQLKAKQGELDHLKHEVDKARSVLEKKAPTRKQKIPVQNVLTELSRHHEPDGPVSHKRHGISGESSDTEALDSVGINIEKFEKDFRSKQLIKAAIQNNDFFRHVGAKELQEIVDCMYVEVFPQSSFIACEGDAGEHLFVLAEGQLEVSKERQLLGYVESGAMFGELAILYNCTRTATVKALTECKLWSLSRRAFQAIMMKSSLQRQEDATKLLLTVPLLKELSHDQLFKVADSFEVEYYSPGEYIIREGAMGDTFYIIIGGEVSVTQQVAPSSKEEQQVRVLKYGDYFGERALLSEERRTANVIALPPGVECLTLNRNSFVQLIGHIQELKNRTYGDHLQVQRPASRTEDGGSSGAGDLVSVGLEDLERIVTLGVGGFGRVDLVTLRCDKSRSFALKCLSKHHIVKTRQQEHVFSEKRILEQIKSPFAVRLFKALKDSRYVYFMMEACLGGEIWTILRNHGHFEDKIAKFVVACVIEVLEYLHSKRIIYRDLKPENLMLDHRGFIKLVDFGFSKKLSYGRKTWTFCGTPEYVAPETILNKGHDFAADYWALGILVHELTSGNPPFMSKDPMKIYNLILRGIEMIELPETISKNARNLIRKLCKENPSERIGYQKGGIEDMRKHRWFEGFDWKGLRHQQIKSPLQPNLSGPLDTKYFDDFPSTWDDSPEELSGWDQEF